MLDTDTGAQRLPEETDVLVIGAGMAGHAAAISAAEVGADVLLIEKRPDYGGSSILSGATFAFAGTPAQMANGIDDSTDRLRADLLDVGGHRNDPTMVDLYLDHQLETHAWMEAIGVDFQDIQLSSNMSVPRSHPAVPRQIFDCLRGELAKRNTIRYAPDTGASRLIRDDLNGRVSSVKVEGPGGSAKIAVRQGVVIASGGFARNDALVQTFAPDQAPALRLGGEGSDGDGLRMAWALGADMADMGYVRATFGIAMPDVPGSGRTHEGPRPLLHAMYRGGLIVNREGRRFISEASSYKVLGDACLRQPDAVAFQIFDARVMSESREAPVTHNYAAAEKAGLLHEGGSLGEACVAASLDPDVVVAEVDAYNAAVDGRGPDAFGRETLGMGYGIKRRIDAAPFYVYPCTAGLFSTYAGLRTDGRLRVLSVTGEPIHGLFAAGEVLGGFHGKGYVSGSAMGKAAVFGRLAGRNAADA